MQVDLGSHTRTHRLSSFARSKSVLCELAFGMINTTTELQGYGAAGSRYTDLLPAIPSRRRPTDEAGQETSESRRQRRVHLRLLQLHRISFRALYFFYHDSK